MKRRQRFITMMFLLGICMLAKAGDVNQVGSIWYDIDISTKTASVVASSTGGKYVGEVNIPATINFDGTVRVIAIGANAFKSSTLLTKVTMTSQITSIGEYAFNGCTSLEEISGYTNVTSIGQSAFSGCSKLTEFHIYSPLTSVGKAAFNNCTGLQAVYAHDLASFGSISFVNNNDGSINSSNPLYYAKRLYKYDNLRRMWLPTMHLSASGNSHTINGNTYINAKCHTVKVVSGTTKIGFAAFTNSEMEELILPSSLTDLSTKCFAGCTKLKRVSCAAIKPPSATAKMAPFNGVDLSKVVLYVPASSVSDYSSDTYWGKFGEIKPIPTTLETKTFGGIKMELKATSTASVVNFDASVLPPNVHIPDYIAYDGYTYPVTSIREFAFEDCEMSTLDLPTDISYIGSYAFEDCKSLVEVFMDKAIENIDSNPFKGCISLQNVRITTATPPAAPNDWENIGNATLEVPPSSVSAYSSTAPWSGFKSVSELTGEHFWYKGIRYFLNYDGTASVTGFNEEEMDEDVTILSKLPLETNYTVTSIADRAFDSGYYNWETYNWEYTSSGKIKSIVIPGTVKTIGKYAFNSCKSLQSVVLGNGIETIESDAFDNTSLIMLNIPGSIKTIGNSAFGNCVSLTSLTLNNGIETIGRYAFSNAKITTVDIPSSVKRIDTGAFQCHNLATITLHEGLEYLSTDAFWFSGITSVTIPRSVKEIGGNPFTVCTALESIQVESGNPYYDSRGNCNAIIETATNKLITGCRNTVIPEDVKTIGKGSFSANLPVNLVIPNQVTTIEESAFTNSYHLTSITIGKNVSSIEKENFIMGSSGIDVTDVYSYANTPPSLGTHVFCAISTSTTDHTIHQLYWSYASRVTLHVPASSIDLYSNTEVWNWFNPIVALPDEGITTDISEADTQSTTDQPMYNLSGQKVGKDYKGIVIQNGKKVVIK